MEFNIPSPLKREHEELHEELARATKVAGEIGNAARAVAQILHPHFVKAVFGTPLLAAVGLSPIAGSTRSTGERSAG